MKGKFLIASLLCGTAAAFAPTSMPKASTALKVSDFEYELGAQPPLGFWDPLGLTKNADQARFDRLRYVELKHGRIAMLAFVGNILPRAGYALPGYISFDKTRFDIIPNGAKALEYVPMMGILQIVAFIGALELFVMKDVYGLGEFPGDFRNGFIDFGWDNFTEEEKFDKRSIELNNGRAAMMGILGLMVHEQLMAPLPVPFIKVAQLYM